MQTYLVQACYAPWQPLQNHRSRHLGGWAMPGSTEEMLDGQHQRVDIPAHAGIAHDGLLQKRLEKDLHWMSLMSLWQPKLSGTEFSWIYSFRTMVFCVLFLLCRLVHTWHILHAHHLFPQVPAMAQTTSLLAAWTALSPWGRPVNDPVSMATKLNPSPTYANVTPATLTLAVKRSVLPMEHVTMPPACVKMVSRESFASCSIAQVWLLPSLHLLFSVLLS